VQETQDDTAPAQGVPGPPEYLSMIVPKAAMRESNISAPTVLHISPSGEMVTAAGFEKLSPSRNLAVYG
jgi:hypothetical protein